MNMQMVVPLLYLFSVTAVFLVIAIKSSRKNNNFKSTDSRQDFGRAGYRGLGSLQDSTDEDESFANDDFLRDQMLHAAGLANTSFVD